MKVTIEITLNSLRQMSKKARSTGAIVSIVLALTGGSYFAAGHAQLPQVSINWSQES